MGRITVLDNPLEPEATRAHAHTGPLIDWLQREYPAGFGGRQAVITVNGARLAVADYDRPIGPDDAVRVSLYPGVAAALASVGIYGWWAVAASAVISIAASYLINAVFAVKPDKPARLGDTPAPSPTYSLGPPQVSARLGEPIPVQYGRVVAVPDVASQPYTWFADNQQYLAMILCLGCGEFDVQELFISDTPASQMAGGVLAYTVIGPTDHGQQSGAVRDLTGILEDVDTSVEVSDQQLMRDPTKAEVYDAVLRFDPGGDYVEIPGTGAPATVQAGDIIGLSRPRWAVEIPDPLTMEWTLYTVASISVDRKTVWLVEDAGNTGDSTTRLVNGEILTDGDTAHVDTDLTVDRATLWVGMTVDVVQRGDVAATTLDAMEIDTDVTGTFEAVTDLYISEISGGEDPTPVEGTVTVSSPDLSGSSSVASAALTTTVVDDIVGSFTAVLSDAGHDFLEFDAIDGDIVPFCREMELTLSDAAIVNVDWDPPNPVVGPFAVCAPRRRVSHVEVDIVFPGGIYTANDDGTLGAATVGIEFVLEAIDDDGTPLDPPSTATHTEYVSAATNTPQRRTFRYTCPSSGRWRVSAERLTPNSARAQDQSTCTWTGLKGILLPQSAPVWGEVTLIAVMLKATNGLASDAAGRVTVDCSRRIGGVATTSAAVAVRDLWTNAQYGVGRDLAELDTDALSAMESSGAVFNARFDKPVALWQALGHITRPGYWFPAPLGSQITFVRDAPIATVSRALTDDQVSDLRLSYQFDTADAADGIEIEYRDQTAGDARYVRYPTNSVRPDRQVLFGCTNEDAAETFARAQWTRQKYRRRGVEFATELDGHLLEIGSRVSLDHPLTGVIDLLIQSVTVTDEYHCRVGAYVYDARAYG